LRGKGFAGGRATCAALAWDSLEQWCVGGVEREDVDSSGQTTVSEQNAKWTAVAAAEGRANNHSCASGRGPRVHRFCLPCTLSSASPGEGGSRELVCSVRASLSTGLID
jgi:hypothetical protein